METRGSDGCSRQDGGRRISGKSRPRGAEQCCHSLWFASACVCFDLSDKLILYACIRRKTDSLLFYLPLLCASLVNSFPLYCTVDTSPISDLHAEQVLHCYTNTIPLNRIHSGTLCIEVSTSRRVFLLSECVCYIKNMTLAWWTQVQKNV